MKHPGKSKVNETPQGLGVFELGINPFGWRVMMPCLIPAFAAMFAPLDVLSRFAVLRHFVDSIVGVFPFMTAKAEATAYPQAWLLSQCLMLAVVLPTALCYMKRLHYGHERIWQIAPSRVKALTKTQHLQMTVGLPLTIGLTYVAIAIPGDPFFARGFTTHNNVGLAFMTTITTWCLVMAIAGQYANIRLFIHWHMRNTKLAEAGVAPKKVRA